MPQILVFSVSFLIYAEIDGSIPQAVSGVTYICVFPVFSTVLRKLEKVGWRTEFQKNVKKFSLFLHFS